SLARRSAQTAMYHIAEAMVRWLAPVLSFTAEEIWTNLPGERSESVMLDGWYLIPGGAQPETAVDWGVLLKVREAVSRELEKLRRENRIGSGLAAEVRIYCDDTIREKLAAVDDELRFVLITSEAQVYPREERPEDAVEIEGFPAGALYVAAGPCEHPKCVRCWHRRPDVGRDEKHPEICGRCVSNVEGPGEERRFA
ncbi:MAG: class I tRNA ligase family protein, partial [Gammaproteobacteria bacterium]